MEDLLLLARLLSEGPAKLAGLAHRKGVLAPGMDADIVVGGCVGRRGRTGGWVGGWVGR